MRDGRGAVDGSGRMWRRPASGQCGEFDALIADRQLGTVTALSVQPGTTTFCADLFHSDGALCERCDVDSFRLVFGDGPCTLCGQHAAASAEWLLSERPRAQDELFSSVRDQAAARSSRRTVWLKG